jgi:Chalcone isomerase-like
MIMRRVLILRWLFVLAMFGVKVPAVELEGIHFPDRLLINAQELPLRGTAEQTWKIWWTIHVTGWWQSADKPFTDDATKVLELAYFHDIPASAFVTATKDGFARGRSSEQLIPLQTRIEQWNAAYRDIKKGQHYRMIYRPQKGTTLVLREKTAQDKFQETELVTIPGLDFANGLFGIWLSDHPVDRAHRDDLLDGK